VKAIHNERSGSGAVVEIPQREGPWDAPGTLLFYGGRFSNFAATPGLRLPEGWYGHARPAPILLVATVEHYFQACKATTRADFLWVLSAPSAPSAKRRGSRHGEGGRRLALRPDWELVKLDVMRVACRAKFTLPEYRAALVATGERVLVENSPTDFVWGGRDRHGGHAGRNLLGVVLMEIRSEVLAAGAGRPRRAF
jgi:ribA/ribD-fused uncharacterized protein